MGLIIKVRQVFSNSLVFEDMLCARAHLLILLGWYVSSINLLRIPPSFQEFEFNLIKQTGKCELIQQNIEGLDRAVGER